MNEFKDWYNISVTYTIKGKNKYWKKKLTINIENMDHSELVAEMAQVEHLSTQDRLHLARM